MDGILKVKLELDQQCQTKGYSISQQETLILPIEQTSLLGDGWYYINCLNRIREKAVKDKVKSSQDCPAETYGTS